MQEKSVNRNSRNSVKDCEHFTVNISLPVLFKCLSYEITFKTDFDVLMWDLVEGGAYFF